jgi:hypothetical protein
LTLPREHRFLERQYARAVEALAYIADAGGPGAAKALDVLELNGRAEDQHRSAQEEWTPPEVEEFWTNVVGPDPDE